MRSKKELVGHMVVGCMVVTNQIEMINSEMAYFWTLQKGEGINICKTLVLIQISTMIVIGIVLTGGVIRDTFLMSLRKRSHQNFDRNHKIQKHGCLACTNSLGCMTIQRT